MSFDKPTRNLLAKMTAAARDRLAEDIAAQLQTSYGLYPDGSRLDVAQLPEDRHAAAELRALLDHFESAEPEGKQRKTNAYQRLVREIGFTLLNRLAALRLCEERGLVIECVRAGMNSAGFQLYDRLAGGALGNRYQTYRAFLACMFDELAADLGALFDRSTPQSAVFPSEPALNDVLALLNDTELASRKIWQQDETIGWIYQYYNDPAERKKMRDESQAPRNSHELAVRNQFFTPRYVVEFLTDNTLGRTWYEMRQGQTKLTEQCRYLVQRRHPIFLAEGQEAPAPFDPATSPVDPDLPGEMWVRPNPELESISELFTYSLTVGGYDYARQVLNIECSELANSRREQYTQTGKWEGSFEELRCCLFFEQRRYHHFGRGPEGEDAQAITNLHKAICDQWDREVDVVPFRAKKDPRRLRVLDPACGSGHFLLYAFDLLETIYAEAYDDPDLGPDLQDAFPDRAGFSRQVPSLILENNLHGIDIDPRAAQIAALALWLRAQRAWQTQKLGAAERPQIGRTHIVVAEPMPGDEGLLGEFISDLPKDQHPEIIGPLVRTVFEKMKLAGEAGSLLKIEEELTEVIEQARFAWSRTPQTEQLSFLPGEPKPKQLGLDISGVTDESFWQQAEGLVLLALEDYAREAENGKGIRRRLFAGDAAQGFAFIDICRKHYDIVLMNPPFGEVANLSKSYLWMVFASIKYDLFAMFVTRWLGKLGKNGLLGAITNKTGFFLQTFEEWRRTISKRENSLELAVDLGFGVLDTAMVETMAYTIRKVVQRSTSRTVFIRITNENDRSLSLLNIIDELKNADDQKSIWFRNVKEFDSIPYSPLCYWAGEGFINIFKNNLSFAPTYGHIYQGIATGDNFRFLRCRWEVPSIGIECKDWITYAKGGTSSLWYSDFSLVVLWRANGREIKANAQQQYGSASRTVKNEMVFMKPGITYTQVTIKGFFPRALPEGCIFDMKGPSIQIKNSDLYTSLGLFASTPVRAMAKLLTDNRQWHPTNLMHLPYPILGKDSAKEIQQCVKRLVKRCQVPLLGDETSGLFIQPLRNNLLDANGVSEQIDLIDQTVDSSFNSSILEFKELDKLFTVEQVNVDEEDGDGLFKDENPFSRDISYAVGCVLGRWDVRYCTRESILPEISDAFAPLPSCPPGMLKNNKGLPATPSDIPNTYPLSIMWDGILIDDEAHPYDIEKCVREVLSIAWKSDFKYLEAESLKALDIMSLREYFRKPSGFFADHLKRYSKSRRQAPIYWPVSTHSGSYTLWIYYHRLNSETLYTAVNRFVSPKIEQVERYLGKLEDDLEKVFGRSAGELRDKVDSTRAFLVELNEFRAELLRVANLPYQPDLNDGVIINAAPLYKLFRLTKWSRDCQAVWEKLEAGEYDWAHMAYVLWPDRVREKCKKDKSLAIAHGLEELYQGEEKGRKGKRKKKVEEEQDKFDFI